MPSATPTDRANDSPDARAAAWCRGIRAGDPEAFADFYRHWFDRAASIVRAKAGRDESFSLDVVQDAMMRLARDMPQLQSERDLTRWVTRVLTSCALDRLRAEARESARRARSVSASAATPTDGDAMPTIAEAMQSLERQLSELKPEQRAALSLRFWLGRSLAAIGGAFSVSEDAAHGRLRTTLRSLRRALQGDDQP